MLLDNSIYGLTKKQTSPTTPQGFKTNTQPLRQLPPAAQSAHDDARHDERVVRRADGGVDSRRTSTRRSRAAYQHNGLALRADSAALPDVHASMYERAVKDPSLVELLVHDDGVVVPELDAIYRERASPTTRPTSTPPAQLADDADRIRLGVFFRDERGPRYDEMRRPSEDLGDRAHRPPRAGARHAMPSDDRVQRALAAVAPQIAAFRSVVASALEHARAVLSLDEGADHARLELGALGSRIDPIAFRGAGLGRRRTRSHRPRARRARRRVAADAGQCARRVVRRGAAAGRLARHGGA